MRNILVAFLVIGGTWGFAAWYHQVHLVGHYIQVHGWTPAFGHIDIDLTLNTPGTDTDESPQLWRDGVTDNGWDPNGGLQFVAHPQEVFQVTGVYGDVFKAQCTTCNYASQVYLQPADYSLGTDMPTETLTRTMPNRAEIMLALQAMSNDAVPYGWGGNTPAGAPLNTQGEQTYDGYGVDCSGMLYLATNGVTPRNTSELVTYGEGINIAGKTAEEIAAVVQPLDIIVWKGHMMVVMPDGQVTESRYGRDGDPSGVQTRDLVTVLSETLEKKVPVNEYSDAVPEGEKPFVIRRFL